MKNIVEEAKKADKELSDCYKKEMDYDYKVSQLNQKLTIKDKLLEDAKKGK